MEQVPSQQKGPRMKVFCTSCSPRTHSLHSTRGRECRRILFTSASGAVGLPHHTHESLRWACQTGSTLGILPGRGVTNRRRDSQASSCYHYTPAVTKDQHPGRPGHHSSQRGCQCGIGTDTRRTGYERHIPGDPACGNQCVSGDQKREPPGGQMATTDRATRGQGHVACLATLSDGNCGGGGGGNRL